MPRKGSGNELFITLLRKAGFTCRPFLGGKQFPDWNPQRGLCPLEENCAFQGLPKERISLFFCFNKSKS